MGNLVFVVEHFQRLHLTNISAHRKFQFLKWRIQHGASFYFLLSLFSLFKFSKENKVVSDKRPSFMIRSLRIQLEQQRPLELSSEKRIRVSDTNAGVERGKSLVKWGRWGRAIGVVLNFKREPFDIEWVNRVGLRLRQEEARRPKPNSNKLKSKLKSQQRILLLSPHSA